jgi:sarcosine oxidase
MQRVDVAIAGLGAMGAFSAWRLAARGANVTGIEQFRPGHDRGSSHGDSRIIRTAYFESPEYVPLLIRAWDLWRSLEGEAGTELLTATGGLMIGMADGEVVSGALASADRHGLAYRLIEAGEMSRSYPQHRLAAGEVAVLEERAGFLRPERSVAAAVARAEAFGAELIVDTQVTAVKATGDGVVLETTKGSVKADRALIAAGPWTSRLMPGLRLPLTVERQVVAWLAVDDPVVFEPGRFPIFGHELPGLRLRYGFPSTDGRSIKLAIHGDGLAADPDRIDRVVGEGDLQPLREFATRWLRGVSSEVVAAGVCMYTNTPDERFIALTPPELPGVTVLSACSGHGFKFAPVIGELMADLICEGRRPPAIIRSDLASA